jgi:hypothetical protein
MIGFAGTGPRLLYLEPLSAQVRRVKPNPTSRRPPATSGVATITNPARSPPATLRASLSLLRRTLVKNPNSNASAKANRCQGPAATIIAASIGLSCGGSLPRQTTATDTRADDPWLEGGERCQAGSQEDPGLRIEELEAGTGKPVEDGQEVRVHYVARLPDGTIIHDTHDGAPIEIFIGSTKIICGFERALLGMRAGEQRRASVPWRLAFGESGRSPDVPPRTDLAFVIDLFLPAVPALENGSRPANPNPGHGGGGRGR